MKQIKTETDEMKRAFELYLGMGRNRHHKHVASLVGKSERTVMWWKSVLKWEERVQQYLNTHNNQFPSGEEDIEVIEPEVISPEVVEKELGLSTLDRALMEMHNQDLIDLDEDGEVLPVKSKADYRKLIKKMVDDFTIRFNRGDVRINSVHELEKMIKLDLLLMGEATQRFNVDGRVVNEFDVHITQQLQTSEEGRELLAQLWRVYADQQGEQRRPNILPNGSGQSQ